MKKEKNIYLIDGSSYVYRAFHAVRGLTNSEGIPTNAVFGFTRMLIKLMEDMSPEYAGIFFDAKGPTFRHEMYSEYKANRPPMPEDLAVQLPFVKEVVEGFNLAGMELQGFEADDLIGTIGRAAEKKGFSVVIVSGDKDFVQLVSEKTRIWDPMKDTMKDIVSVRETTGLEPRQMIDVMGLSGDTSDNVPGVPGIGPKTALTLIRTYSDMETLYDRIDEITKKKQKEKLVANRDQAFLSRDLVRIKQDVPVDFDEDRFRVKEPDKTFLSELFRKFEFSRLSRSFFQKKEKEPKTYTGIFDEHTLSDLIERIGTSGFVSVDTETTSEDPMRAELVGISLSIQENQAYYIPVGHRYLGVPDQLSLSTVLFMLKPVLENPAIKKIGQNIKYDWIVLSHYDIHLSGVDFDTMVASYLINPSKRAHSLDSIALDYLDHKTTTYEQVAGKGKKSIPFSEVTLEKAVPYACEDADLTLMASRVLKQKLEQIGLSDLMQTIEMPLIPVLVKMEKRGVRVDARQLRDLSDMLNCQLESIEAEIHSLAGEPFNVKSSQQLGHILFEKLKLPTKKKTKKKTGFSTDVEVLTELAAKHPLPALVLRHRTLAKLKSSYADSIPALIHPKTNRIHTSYNQTVAATGRLSSSNPNLQNIPIRTEEGREIRKAFIPRDGWEMVSADYSQIELRVLAHCSDDQILIESFHEGEDIHARTAAEVFGSHPSLITPELRRQAKAINFGIIYGMSAFGLSKELSISRKMAKTYIDHYFARYKGVKAFMDRSIAEARETKQTRTLFGRVRLLPEITASNTNVRGFAERTAINTPIQGTAADLIKIAMIQVEQAMEEKKMQSAMLLTVHDELVFETPPDERDQLMALVTDIMENVFPFKVPLKVNIASGKNWMEAH